MSSPECQDLIKDQSDRATKIALSVLAIVNLGVIALGASAFVLRLKIDGHNWKGQIVRFYSTALICLLVTEVYFISGYFSFAVCPQNFLQTFPGVSYLLIGYTYIEKSLKIKKIDDLSTQNFVC